MEMTISKQSNEEDVQLFGMQSQHKVESDIFILNACPGHLLSDATCVGESVIPLPVSFESHSRSIDILCTYPNGTQILHILK